MGKSTKKQKKKVEFKKTFGDKGVSGYSKEYMQVYCRWLKTLSKYQRDTITYCNDLIRKKGKKVKLPKNYLLTHK